MSHLACAALCAAGVIACSSDNHGRTDENLRGAGGSSTADVDGNVGADAATPLADASSEPFGDAGITDAIADSGVVFPPVDSGSESDAASVGSCAEGEHRPSSSQCGPGLHGRLQEECVGGAWQLIDDSCRLSGVTSVSLGENHSCAVADGRVFCWGDNEYGQLGDGASNDRKEPFVVPNLADVIQVAAGGQHTCALLSDTSVRCWGRNTSGQLGDGTSTNSGTPLTVSGLSNVAQISVGNAHTCAVLKDSTAVCWGDNENGQLGTGNTTGSATPVPVTGLVNATSISAGSAHTCALTIYGTLRCWGSNEAGELGDGTTTARLSPVTVLGFSHVVQVSAGASRTCARLEDGSAKCWGNNANGELGDGTTNNRTTPNAVSGLTGATSISVRSGSNFACATRSDGTVWCWGDNYRGQIRAGLDAPQQFLALVPVEGLADAEVVETGKNHSCAILNDGTMKCWGADNSGQLGNGSFLPIWDPAGPYQGTNHAYGFAPGPGPVGWALPIADAVSVDVGSVSSCIARSDGTLSCWGYNWAGQVGDPATYWPLASPVANISGAVQVAVNILYACALLQDGTVRCWGDNFWGELGNGTTANSATPVAVSGITNATAISAASYYGHTCALIADGTVRCWGSNAYGQLGDGTNTDRSTPVAVLGITDAVAISAGDGFTCAARASGGAKCWGFNSVGTLGDASYMDSNVPVDVALLTDVGDISCAQTTACATQNDGTAWCWGGYGSSPGTTYQYYSTPQLVPGITDAVSVATGADYNCAALADGTAACWGYWNGRGQLGDGTSDATSDNQPKTVLGLTQVERISADVSTCAITAGGKLYCWGGWELTSSGSMSNRLSPAVAKGAIR